MGLGTSVGIVYEKVVGNNRSRTAIHEITRSNTNNYAIMIRVVSWIVGVLSILKRLDLNEPLSP